MLDASTKSMVVQSTAFQLRSLLAAERNEHTHLLDLDHSGCFIKTVSARPDKVLSQMTRKMANGKKRSRGCPSFNVSLSSVSRMLMSNLRTMRTPKTPEMHLTLQSVVVAVVIGGHCY